MPSRLPAGAGAATCRNLIDRIVHDGCDPTTARAPAPQVVAAGLGSTGACRWSFAAAVSAGAGLPLRNPGLDPDAGALADRPQCRAQLHADRTTGADPAALRAGCRGRPVLLASRHRLA